MDRLTLSLGFGLVVLFFYGMWKILDTSTKSDERIALEKEKTRQIELQLRLKELEKMNMADMTQQPFKLDLNNNAERTAQVKVAGFTAGISAVVALWALVENSSWPLAFGVAAVAAMVAVVCYFILRQPSGNSIKSQ